MPPKRSAPSSMKMSTSYKLTGPVRQKSMVKRSSMMMEGKRTQVKHSVKQTTKRSVTVTPKRFSIKEVTKKEKSITFSCNSPKRRISAGPSKSVAAKKPSPSRSPQKTVTNRNMWHSPAHSVVQNYYPASGAVNNYSPFNCYSKFNFF